MGPFLPPSLVHGAPTTTFPADFDEKSARTDPPDGLEHPTPRAHLVLSATSSLTTTAPPIIDLTSHIVFSCLKIPSSTPLGTGTSDFQRVNIRMEHATQSPTQFLLNIGTPALPNGTVTTRAEESHLKPISHTHGIQFLGPVERASLKLSPLPQGSFQRFSPENYIVHSCNSPNTLDDLGRFVLPDHFHIISTGFSPSLDPFGSGPPIKFLFPPHGNFTETVNFSQFEDPAPQAHTSDHPTNHFPLITGPQTQTIPFYGQIP
jgi:hypothetical protein